MNTNTDTATELESYIAEQAQQRRERQYAASGRAAVAEIYRHQGEHIFTAFDWKSHWSERMPDTLRAMVLAFCPNAGIDLDCDDYTMTRAALSNPAIAGAFGLKAGSQVVIGYVSIVDTTKGIVTEVPAPTFLASDLVTIEDGSGLAKQTRGREAEHADFAAATTSRSVVRFSKQIAADEMEIVDSGTTTGAWLEAFAELGRKARRTYLDLCWSKFLRNPTMYDGTAMFHANHANYVADVLAATGFAKAIEKLSAQVITGKHGEPVHMSLTPKYLFTPAPLGEKGRELCRLTMIDGDERNITPVTESRLGAVGAFDPDANATVTSVDTCWVLAAPAAQRPSMIVSYLEGSSTSPVVRPYSFDSGGEWGMGWDILLDVGVAFSDWRPWLFSTGVGA